MSLRKSLEKNIREHRAKLVIHDADKLSKAEMFELTKWLRNLSYELADNIGNLSKRFTARLMK